VRDGSRRSSEFRYRDLRDEHDPHVAVVEHVHQIGEPLRGFATRGRQIRDLVDDPEQVIRRKRQIVGRRRGVVAEIAEVEPETVLLGP